MKIGAIGKSVELQDWLREVGMQAWLHKSFHVDPAEVERLRGEAELQHPLESPAQIRARAVGRAHALTLSRAGRAREAESQARALEPKPTIRDWLRGRPAEAPEPEVPEPAPPPPQAPAPVSAVAPTPIPGPTPVPEPELEQPLEPAGWNWGSIFRWGLRIAVVVILLLIFLLGIPLRGHAQRRSLEVQWRDEGVLLGTRGGGARWIIDCTGAGLTCTISGATITIDGAAGGGGYATIENEGTPLTQRTVLNFTGAGVTCVDDGPGVETDCDVPGGAGNLDLLDGSIHQDTAVGTAVRGDIITVPVSGLWTRFPVGGANTILGSDGTDPSWETATGTASPVRANNPLFPVQVRFTAIAAPGYAAGNLFYDSTDQALTFHNDEADVALQMGQESWVRVRNVTGSTINNGQVVYIVGIASGLPSIALARADVMATSQAVGIATHSIEDLTNGYITAFGLVRDFDTSAFTIADRVYLSASTAGLLTNTAPSDPNFVVPIGIVTEVNATTGDVLVTLAPPRPTGGAGIQVVGNTISTLSSEEDFLVSGALSCGVNTRGKAQTHTTPLQYCDNAAPPVLQYAAYAASDGDARAGDSATNFFDTGTLELAVIPDGTANQVLGTDAAGTAAEHKSLATGTAGTDFAILHGAGLVTFNLPLASGTNTGKLSNTDWTTFDNSVDSVGGGNGITSSGGQAPSIAVDLLTVQDGTGLTFSFSGLEFQGAGADRLTLLQGCADLDVIKWDDEAGGNGRWDCAADVSGGSPSLNTITAAVGAATINSGDNAIVWNWSITTASKIGFKIGENIASVAITDPILFNIATLTASTAHPFQVTSRGNTNGLRVGATDGILIELGGGGVDFGALLNYPTACSATFVRAILDSPTCEAVSLTADVSGTLPGANGGTNNAFMAFTGPATSLKTFTLPNATSTILTDNAAVTIAQGGTGQTTANPAFNALSPVTTEGDIIFRNATVNARLARGANGECLTANATTILWGSCGGTIRWDQLIDPTAATGFTADATAETLTFINSSAFSAGSQILFSQTGAPTAGGNFWEVRTVDADALILFNMNADLDLFVSFQAGSTADQDVLLAFKDFGGANEWTFGKNSGNSLVIDDVDVSITRMLLAGGGTSTFRSGSSSADIIFQSGALVERFRVDGATDTIFVGAGSDTGIARNAAGIVGITSVIDVATGFRIGGAAATDDCLLGNATNFVASSNCVLVGDSPNAAGDISGDYSGGLTIDAGAVASAELATANKTFDKSIVVIDPTTGEDDKVQWMHGKAVTYVDVDCSTDAGTATIDMDHRVLTTPNTVGTDILTGTIVCDTDNQADGGFADATIPANVPVNLSITAVSGAGTVRIHIRGTVD